jgi:hypothetical protein
MCTNLFRFGSRYFKLNAIGAMGTPCSVCTSYATIYYSHHKETSLLQSDNDLLFYWHLIDHAFIIQHNITDGYERFMQRMNSFCDDEARLEWESPGPSREILFHLVHTYPTQPEWLHHHQGMYKKLMNLYMFVHLPQRSHQAC